MAMFSSKKRSNSSPNVALADAPAKNKRSSSKKIWNKEKVQTPSLETLMQQTIEQNQMADEKAQKAEARAGKAEKIAEKAEERALKAEQRAKRTEAKLEAILDNVNSLNKGYLFC